MTMLNGASRSLFSLLSEPLSSSLLSWHTEYGPRHICIVKSRLLLFTERHLLSHHENINLLLTLQQSLNSVPGLSHHPNVAYLTAPSFRVRTGIQFIILAAVTPFLPLLCRCAFRMKVVRSFSFSITDQV